MIDVSFKFRRCPLSWLWNGHVNRLLAGSSEENENEKEREIDVQRMWPPKLFLKTVD